MIKKIKFLASTAAVLTTILTFSSAHADNINTSNFYVGGFGGWDWNRVDVPDGTSFKPDGSDWGGFVGYNFGTTPDQGLYGLRTGIEAHYGWTGSNSEAGIIDGTSTSLEKKHEWGVDLRPGFGSVYHAEPVDINPYAILGYRQAEFSNSVTSDTTHPGFDLGLGTELISYEHFGVRLDYTHVFYRSEEGIEPHEDDLRLGLAYHF